MSLDALLHRRPPTWWELFFQAPCKTIALSLYQWRQPRTTFSPSTDDPSIKITCISDTHNGQLDLPAGDVLIHAGDLTQKGTLGELQAQLDWINRQPHHHKIVIAGNHDMLLDLNKTPGPENDKSRKSLNWGDMHYLHNESITLRFKGGRALSIYGNPWTRKHGNWAFQYLDSFDFWRDRIPDDTDVLVTHMPPQCHLDLGGEGDPALLQELRRVKPMLHVFGHFHASAGVDMMAHDGCEDAFVEVVRAGGGVWTLLRFVRALVGRAWGERWGVRRCWSMHRMLGGIWMRSGGRQWRCGSDSWVYRVGCLPA